MRNSYNRFLKGLFAAIFFLGITSVANAQKEQPDSVSAVSRVNMDHLKKYPTLQLSNALQGQAAGLIAIVPRPHVLSGFMLI